MEFIKFKIAFFLLVAMPAAAFAGNVPAQKDMIELKAWGVPSDNAWGLDGEVAIKIVQEFQRLHPNINPVPASGLDIPNRSMDTVPLMQIAGDISPAVLYVNFRQSSTYINQKFLYPIDKYLEKESGTDVRDGHLMGTAQYLAALRKGACYDQKFEERLSPQCWEVIRRECPYGESCP